MLAPNELSSTLLNLPLDERLNLIALLESSVGSEYEQLIEQRLRDHRAGKNPEVSWDDAMKEIFRL